MIGAGLESRWALGMLHGNAGLVLASSFRVYQVARAPAGVANPGPQRAARRFRRLRADQSGPAPAWGGWIRGG
jgi:hypothetical protein